MRRLPLRSPPRMRGKGIADDEARAAVGITPACAGKSELPRFFLRCPWDHPRVCGEKMVSMIPHRRSRGSPPRVRGKEDGFAQLGNVGGITPAYAGKRRCPRFRPGKIRDHPRVCGEKPPSCPEMSTNEGSPPRMRGKVLKLQNALKKFRITPAYAGKRPRTLLAGSSSRDHPRVCGEKCISGICKKCRSGSPPRVRGKGSKNVPKKRSMGITPACAGKRTFVPLVKSTA